jgi:hypothetical protein
MNTRAFDMTDTAELMRLQSSSENLPRRRFDWFTRPSEEIMRNDSCSADISMLKIAT